MHPENTLRDILPPLGDESAWLEAERLIETHRTFLLTTHANPDGDGLGSQVALRSHLLSRGKRVRLVNPNPFPPNLRFLDPSGDTLVVPDGDEETALPAADAIILLDASTWRRMGSLGARLAALHLPTITLDHHPENRERVGGVCLIDTGAAATGEIVYRVVHRAGGPWTPEVALALYVAIVTDTGSFRFTNTSPLVHRMAAHLLDLGVSPRAVYGDVYERRTIAQMRLLGEVLAGISTDESGHIVCLSLNHEMLERYGLSRADLEGFVDFTYLVGGSEVGLQLVETRDGRTRVSLRSKGRVNVGLVAERLGGGGHEHAAGVNLATSLGESRRRVLAECKRVMKGDSGGGDR